MARLYGKKEEIDSNTVKNFFDKRAEKDVENLMTITSFQGNDTLEQRQKEEIDVISKKIDFNGKKILEIGCGLGRWAEFFNDKCSEYVGIDYSENLIEIAKKHYNFNNCHFEILSATEIDEENLPLKGPYDIIFITGVIMYLNDEDIKIMIEKINKLIHSESILYIRESISVLDTRLTLKDFYSEELESDYNVIYRTEEELLEFFEKIENISSIEKSFIHTKLTKFNETSFKYFILK